MSEKGWTQTSLAARSAIGRGPVFPVLSHQGPLLTQEKWGKKISPSRHGWAGTTDLIPQQESDMQHQARAHRDKGDSRKLWKPQNELSVFQMPSDRRVGQP